MKEKKTTETELRTKRLRILPLTPGEMKLRASSTTALEKALGLMPSNDYDDSDPHLMAAYAEMAELCEKNPDNYLFYTDWLIILRKENRIVGSLGFKGVPDENSKIEIGYGICSGDRRKGYASEAVAKALEWAFMQENVYYVTAQTEPDNVASMSMLKKSGFSEAGQGEEGPLFELEKPKGQWMSVFMLFGMSVGMSIGALFDSIPIGLSLGMCTGLALGCVADAEERRKREHKGK